MMKTFGIIGAGNIGQTVAGHLVKAGYPVILSSRRGPGALNKIIDSLGGNAKAGTTSEAAGADIVVLALPWSELSTLTALTDWTNRIVVDATNHFVTFYPDFQLADLGDRSSSEVVAAHLPGAHLVKAFNTLYFQILAKDPRESNGNRVLFISGDDAAAKSEVSDAIDSLGFTAVDLGSLATGSKLQQANGPLASLNLIKVP